MAKVGGAIAPPVPSSLHPLESNGSWEPTRVKRYYIIIPAFMSRSMSFAYIFMISVTVLVHRFVAYLDSTDSRDWRQYASRINNST